jgi:dipeptidyl aminopeptidase/acylaminoacyl peptidase
MPPVCISTLEACRNRPLLIGQGANDPRVNIAEWEQIVSAIEKNHGAVTYVVYLLL